MEEKRDSCPCFCWSAARAPAEWKPVAGNGEASLVLLVKFIYLIHAGDDFNNKKSAPSYPSLSEYWQFLFITGPLSYSKTALVFWACVFYLQFMKEEINLSESISLTVMKERILLLSHFSTRQEGLVVSIVEIIWHCKYFLEKEKLLLWVSKWTWVDYKYGNDCKCLAWCTAQSI